MIKIRSLHLVTSENATAGSSVPFEIAESLVIDGVVVLSVGEPVNGTIIRAKPGIPYSQWPDLAVRVTEVKVGNSGRLRLTRSDPRHRPTRRIAPKDVALCMLLFPFCIASGFGISEDGPTKPNAESGIQGELTPCETWHFWTKSSITIPAAALTGRANNSPEIECTRMLENPSCDYLEIE